MKIVLIITILLASYPSFSTENGLPTYPDMTPLYLNKIPHTDRIQIKAEIIIPNHHKTKGMPSALRVFEKINRKWELTHKIATHDLMRIGNKIFISENIQLRSKTNPIAIDSTIYHCGKYCVINNFQGIVKRDVNKSSSQLNIKLKGYLPTDRIKKEFIKK